MKSIRFGLIVIAVCGLIVLGAGIRVVLWTQTAQAITTQEQRIARQVLALQQINAAVAELTNRERGYLLTGDAGDLGSYQRARRDLAAALKTLDDTFAGEAAPPADITEITELARATEDAAVRAVQLRSTGQEAAARDIAFAAPTRQASETIRDRLSTAAEQRGLARLELERLLKDEFWNIYALSALVVLVVDLLVVVAIVSLSIAIQRVREQQREQMHQAMHDALTGLPNRRYMGEWLTMALAAARRSSRPLVLLYLDLDGFKSVNDRFGHATGDRVLQVTAARLRSALRLSDFFARLGGDEFVAILPEAPTVANLAMLIERLQGVIEKAPLPQIADGMVRASVGAAWFPIDGDSIETLLAAADKAMYVAKQRHRAATADAPTPIAGAAGRVRSAAS